VTKRKPAAPVVGPVIRHAFTFLQQARIAQQALDLAILLGEWDGVTPASDLAVEVELVHTGLRDLVTSITQSWVCTGLEPHCAACGAPFTLSAEHRCE